MDLQRITLVEPDKGVREVIRILMTSLGYQVRLITGQHEILRKVILQKPDTLIINMSTPSNHAIDLCIALKRHPMTKRIPLIVITTNLNLKDKIERYCDGQLLNMPFDIIELEACVQIALSAVSQNKLK